MVRSMNAAATSPESDVTVSLEEARAQLAAAHAQIAEREAERKRLKETLERLWFELALLKRRMFIAKAERVDTTQEVSIYRGAGQNSGAKPRRAPIMTGAGTADRGVAGSTDSV